MNSADGTGSTSSNSGLEFQGSGSNELTVLQGCANNEVLSWNDSTNVWQCASVSGVGGVTGSSTNGYVAYWNGTSTLSGEAQLSVSRGGTGIGSYTIGDILYASGTTTLAALADVATGNVLLSGGVGVAPAWGKVNLATAVSGTLPVANGGTGATTFTANAVLYGNGTGAVQVTSAGTNGQLLLGVSSGAPTFATLSSDATITNAGVLTISANAVALTTDTTGNYVASIASGNGISGSSASEGGTPTIAIDLLDSADGTGSTSSNSGLEFQGSGSNELTVLQGCANNEVLSWNDSTNVWQCASVSGVGGVTGSSTNGYVAYWNGTSTLSGEAQLSVSRGGTGIGSYTIGDILYASGTTTLAALADVATGNVLLSGGVGVAPAWGKVNLATAVSGTLPVANGGTGATSLNDLITLGTHTTGNYVASITNGNGISGSSASEGGTPTIALGVLTSDWNQTGAFDIVLNNASSELRILESAGATFYGTLDVADLSADRTYTFPNVGGTVALIDGGQTFTSATWQGTAVAVAYGGTGATTLTPNGVLYGNGTSPVQVTSAGTSGQLLVANGSGVPTFVSLSSDATLSNTGALTIAANSVALTTDTTGNYVQSLASGNGITGGAAGSEGATLTLSIDLLDSDDGTGLTSSNSGLEFAGTGNNELTLLQGCANNDVLAYNTTTEEWSCASVSGVGGATASGSSGQAAYFSGSSSLQGENQLNVSRGGTGVNGSSASNGQLLIGNGTGYTLATLTQGSGITITNGSGTITIASTLGTSIDLTTEVTGTLPVGNGGTGATSLNNLITLSTHTTGNYVASITNGNGISGSSASEGGTPTIAIDLLDSADGTGSTSSNSGLEFQGSGSNELGLLQGCSNGQGLSWNDSTNVWECASFSAGLTGSGTNGYVAYWTGTSSLAAEAQLNVSRGGTGVNGSSAGNGNLLIGNGTGYTLATLTQGSGITVTNGSGTITVASTLEQALTLLPKSPVPSPLETAARGQLPSPPTVFSTATARARSKSPALVLPVSSS
ncbi:MAG: hypothetical protein WDN67_03260 [Candidatus Moraniibacteriota bacterium]